MVHHHHRAGLFLTARLLLCAAMSLIVVSQVTGFAPQDPPPSDDLDGDEVKDTLEPEPDPPGSAPGEVEVRSGANNLLIVTIRGRESNDRFGYSIGIVDDLNLDGHKDLIIGAPRDSDTGRAHVFLGPFLDTGPILITAENADMTLASPDLADDDFGERVAPMSDIDHDGVTDLRIRAWFVDGTTTESHTYFFSGSSGAPLFVVTGDDPFDPWAEVPGDADGDGDVDEKDEQAVLDNLGLTGAPGTLAKSQGDLNGDGIVNGLDLALVEGNFATNIFASFATAAPACQGGQPPAGHHCVTDCNGVSRLYFTNVAPGCGPIAGTPPPPINDPNSPEYDPWHKCSHPSKRCWPDQPPNWRNPNWWFFFFRGNCNTPEPYVPGSTPGEANNPLGDAWNKCHALSDPDRDGLRNHQDHDDDGDGIPDENDPDPYYPCYISGNCPGTQPPQPPDPPPPEEDPPQPPPQGGPPPPECNVEIGFWFGWHWWWDWLPEYIDSQFTPFTMQGWTNWPNCQWNWSAGGIAQIQDQSQPPYATVALNGPGAGSVTGTCQCDDVWNFTAVDMQVSLDTPDVTFPGNPPHVTKFLWVNGDDDHGADGPYGQSGIYGQPDLSASQVSDEDDLVALNLSALIGVSGNPFTQPMWSLSYDASTIRVWFKMSSDGAVFNNAYGGPWANPVDKSFNGGAYRLFPLGQWINGMPSSRQFWIEGIAVAQSDTTIYYGFQGSYTHSESNQPHGFSLWRSTSAIVASIYLWCDTVFTAPGGFAWITNTVDPEGEPSPNPRMPQIRALCVPLQLTDMNVEWKLQIDYTRSNRNDHKIYGPQILDANEDWYAHDLFGDGFHGGQALITAKLPALGNKSLKTVFAIRAMNPPEQVAIDFIGNDRWYDRYIAAHEGGIHNGRKYIQFNDKDSHAHNSLSTSVRYTPNASSDGGFGMFQLTLWGVNQTPSPQHLWNWQQNVITGKQVIATKLAEANNWMQGQRGLAGGAPVPVHVVAGITFADGTDKPIEHAVGIKRYNGASSPPGSGLPGNYCFWNASAFPPKWDFSKLNNLGFNYVERICEEASN